MEVIYLTDEEWHAKWLLSRTDGNKCYRCGKSAGKCCVLCYECAKTHKYKKLSNAK